MFTAYQTTEELSQNLTDAGCSGEMIDCLLACLLAGNKAEGLCRLAERRREILNEIHKERAGIEYLDELLLNLREQKQ